MYATSKEAKQAKWFSRRHQTSSAHEAARAEYDMHLKEKQARIHLNSKRTPIEQFRRLDERLGNGQGAEKERSRLRAQIAHSS